MHRSCPALWISLWASGGRAPGAAAAGVARTATNSNPLRSLAALPGEAAKLQVNAAGARAYVHNLDLPEAVRRKRLSGTRFLGAPAVTRMIQDSRARPGASSTGGISARTARRGADDGIPWDEEDLEGLPAMVKRLKVGNCLRLAVFVGLMLFPLPWVWINPTSGRIPASAPETTTT